MTVVKHYIPQYMTGSEETHAAGFNLSFYGIMIQELQ